MIRATHTLLTESSKYTPCLGQRLYPVKQHVPYPPPPTPPPLGTQFSSQFNFSWLIHAFLMKMIESNQQREANKVFP